MATESKKKPRIVLAKNMRASEKYGDDIIEGAISLNVLDDPKVKPLIYGFENGERYINVKVRKRKTPGEKGTTHYMEIDPWVPNRKGA